MAGILGVLGAASSHLDKDALVAILDPLGLDEKTVLQADPGFLGVSAVWNSSFKGRRYYETNRFAACLAGDLVEFDEVPWERFIECARVNGWRELPEMAGLFALAILDKTERVLYLVSDLYLMYPLFYFLGDGAAALSSASAVFPRIARSCAFNPDWLYEYLFFSFPVGPTGMYKNIKRMPRYFGETGPFAHALSGGYDTRTVLAFVPPAREKDIETYTYGRAGSHDITESRMMARSLGLPHREIYFDGAYERICRVSSMKRSVPRGGSRTSFAHTSCMSTASSPKVAPGARSY